MDYKHYILTRFNLGVYDQNNAYAELVGDPHEWMEHRLRLFEETTFPSILEQENKNFTWLIAFDERTPDAVINRYDYCDNVEICFEQPHLYLRCEDPTHDWLITTRLDNDDILLPEFTAVIQAEAREFKEVIDIEYQKLRFRQFIKYPSLRPRPNSPFLSLVEPWGDDIMTALGRPHTVMPDVYEARKLPQVLAYQVIHDRNVSNKI